MVNLRSPDILAYGVASLPFACKPRKMEAHFDNFVGSLWTKGMKMYDARYFKAINKNNLQW